MRKFINKLFFRSWIVTLPITILGCFWSYQTAERFYTFIVRYEPAPFVVDLNYMGQYEFGAFTQRIRSGILRNFVEKSSLGSIHLFVPEANLSRLHSHMPQSGFHYVKGRILQDGKLHKVKIKYRGDYIYHWGAYKKSLRIKTAKNSLFDGMRVF